MAQVTASLAPAVQGGKRPSQEVTWLMRDGTPLNLSGVTSITARLRRVGTPAAVTDSDGVFTVLDAAAGVFEWAYGDDDVATAGKFAVKFTANFGTPPTPARTFDADWVVEAY